MVARRQDNHSAAPDADVQARLFAYGQLLGWTNQQYFEPAGQAIFVGTPYWQTGVDVGPTKGDEAWDTWITADSTPFLRDHFERLLLRDHPQCRELKTSLDEGRFATAGDAILVIRLLSAHSEQKLALGRRLDQELKDVGCSIVRARGQEMELLRAEFEQLLHASTHGRGLPQKPPLALEQLSDDALLDLAARRVCLFARAHGHVTDVELKAHAPGRSLKSWRDETVRDWDQVFDEWIVRLFAQLRTVVWNRASSCRPPFPPYMWVGTDPRSGQRRPTGEQIAGGEMAWGAALTGMSLAQLEELSTTRALDRQAVNVGTVAGDQLERQWDYDVTSLADDKLRELVLAIVDKAGYPQLPERVTDHTAAERRDSWRQLVMLRADRADLEDLVDRFPSDVVEPLLAPKPPEEPIGAELLSHQSESDLRLEELHTALRAIRRRIGGRQPTQQDLALELGMRLRALQEELATRQRNERRFVWQRLLIDTE